MLSKADEKLIQDTWAPIGADLKGYGAKLFLRFFTDYPIYQQSFRSFAKVPFDDLHKNKRFITHAFTVMTAVDGMVENIDDPEMLDELLLKTGITHGQRHKISGEAFDEFELSFVGFLQTSLGDKWTGEVEKLWKAVAALIIRKIKDGLEQDF